MLASSANIPDNIKWTNTTANTWTLRAVSILAEIYKPKLQKNFSSPPQWQEATYCPNNLRSALVRVLGQSLVCPFLLQSVCLNQDLKALRQHLKCVPDWGENLVMWPDAIQKAAYKLNPSNILNAALSLLLQIFYTSTFGKWYSCFLSYKQKTKCPSFNSTS